MGLGLRFSHERMSADWTQRYVAVGVGVGVRVRVRVRIGVGVGVRVRIGVGVGLGLGSGLASTWDAVDEPEHMKSLTLPLPNPKLNKP